MENDLIGAPALDEFDSYDQAALNLAVGIEALGCEIDRLITKRDELLRVHRELARAARRVVQAYHDERLDGALLDDLDRAVAKAQAPLEPQA